MIKLTRTGAIVFTLCLFAAAANAAVVPEYATNNYQNHELTRAEKKCIDAGYKITYANCSNQTAPSDRCPYHDSYYRSCSQEQWCRNNNYRFLATDCKLPLYPLKQCDNRFPLYRACKENVIRACEDSGFSSKDECQLTDKRCPYSRNYGICCGDCKEFSHVYKNVPQGYIPDGETCTTCAGVVKTNIKPAPCRGFGPCIYGPMSPHTPSCLQGNTMLYSACKTSDTVCREQGFSDQNCKPTEDAEECPENSSYRRCVTNCFKLAESLYPGADVFESDVTDPVLNLTKTEITSLIGMTHQDCLSQRHPTITLTINSQNQEQYHNILNRRISNVSLKIIFEEPIILPAAGQYNNVKITFEGVIPDCAIQAENAEINGVVSLNDAPLICGSFNVNPGAKLLTTGSIRGDVKLSKDAALGIKGNLTGALKTGTNSEVFIKGNLEYHDTENDDIDSESIVFGCNSKNKIGGSIIADTSSVIVKQWAKLDTANIILKSTSDNMNLPNTLSSLHIYKYAKLFSTYGSGDSVAVFPLTENNFEQECEDKYYIHLGSAVKAELQNITLEPSNRWEDKWKCRKLRYKQQSCD